MKKQHKNHSCENYEAWFFRVLRIHQTYINAGLDSPYSESELESAKKEAKDNDKAMLELVFIFITITIISIGGNWLFSY